MPRPASSAFRVQVSTALLVLASFGCLDTGTGTGTGTEAGTASGALLASCTLDSDCAANSYCNVTQSVCAPKLAAGEPLPVDALHTGACTLQSAALLCRTSACNVAKKTCAAANGTPCSSAAMCTSDVCGHNDLCGIEEGGSCDSGSAQRCQTNRCSVPADASQGRCIHDGGCAFDADCGSDSFCDPNIFSCRPKLAVGISLPRDSLHDGTCAELLAARVCQTGLCNATNNTCAALNGATCEAAEQCTNEVCGDNGRCGLAVGQQGCTSQTQAELCQSGNCAPSGVCVPANGCNIDAECADGMFCNRSDHLCNAVLRAGSHLPKDGLHNGLCSAELARAVCVSGQCNPMTNTCAAPTNTPCASAWQCVTNVCADNGKCGEQNGLGACSEDVQCQSGTCQLESGRCVATEDGCTSDDDCPQTQYCNLTQLRCVDDLADGTLLPADSASGSHCTSEGARAVCSSGACNASTDTCAKAGGSACSEAFECAANVCSRGVCGSPDGTAGACTQDNATSACQSGMCHVALSRCLAADSGCSADRDCASGSYCDGRSLGCLPKLSAGTKLPADELHAASCSAEQPAAVCESGACNERSDACAKLAGASCSSASDCASDVCLDSQCAATGESYHLAGGGCSVQPGGSTTTLAFLWLGLMQLRRRKRQKRRA